MPPFNPSDELVSVRLRALARRDGVEGLMRSYGVSRPTVNRWLQGGNPNADARRSIVRRGRELTGAVVQDPRGGFSTSRTLYRPEAIAFQRAESQRRRERATASIATAATPEEMQMAIAMGDNTSVSIEEATAFDRRLQRLQEWTDQGRDWDDFMDYYGYEDDWDSFRSTYEQMAG
tara:strand:- start:4816 stop:5343 length:528 start_codon:yes stop_codon:yes gene_type:complete